MNAIQAGSIQMNVGNCIVKKFDFGQPESIIQKVEREERYKTCKGDYLPAVVFNAFVETPPFRTP